MNEKELNNYFIKEKLECLKYNMKTTTSPTVYFTNYFGIRYYQDIKITIDK